MSPLAMARISAQASYFARLEAIVTLEEWLKRIPEFEIPAGEKISHKSGIVCTVERLPLVWTPRA